MARDPAVVALLLGVIFGGAVVLGASACSDDPASSVVADGGEDAPSEARPPTRSDGGPGFVVIEVDCPLGTTPETEPNGAAKQANAVDGLSFCGAISPGADVDYSSFSTPTGKKLALFQAVIDGPVDFELTVNGKTLKPTDVTRFEAGDYVVKAFTKDQTPGKYRYRIQFAN